MRAKKERFLIIVKKTLLGIGILIIFVAIVTVLKKNDNSGPSLVKATVTVLAADVYVKPAGSDSFKQVKDTAEVTAGSEIKTSATGRASISYPNDTVTTLDTDSYIKISVLDSNGQKSRIELLVGSVWAKVKNVLATEDFYEVNTENTVASVRGTIFGVSHKDGITNTYGVESNVKVSLLDKTTGKPINTTSVEITSNEKVSVDKKMAEEKRPIVKKLFENNDYTRQDMKKMIEKTMEQSDLRDDKVKNFMKKVIERNNNDAEFIKKIRERRLDILNGTPTPSRTPSPSATPKTSPTVTPTTSATATPTSSATPTPTQSNIPGAVVSPTPTPSIDTSPILESVTPKTVTAGNQFAVNGRYFTIGRDTKQITGVSVGGIAAQFTVLDSLTIFVTPPANLQPGIYDIGATTNSGSVLLLKQAITIQ